MSIIYHIVLVCTLSKIMETKRKGSVIASRVIVIDDLLFIVSYISES
jgi:hypothetical protein